jgi:hypothetical protein
VTVVLIQTRHKARCQILGKVLVHWQTKCALLLGDSRRERKTAPGIKTASKVRRLEYDRHFNSTSGASFHSDHPNLCVGMVQIMTSKLSEIVCSCSRRVGSRDPMRKGGVNKIWCNIRRNVTKGVMFFIHLQRNALSMHPKKLNLYPLNHWAELVLGYLVHVPYQGIRIQDSIARVSLVKERAVSRKMEVTDS